jgi:hypothetical protein
VSHSKTFEDNDEVIITENGEMTQACAEMAEDRQRSRTAKRAMISGFGDKRSLLGCLKGDLSGFPFRELTLD